eukprot:GSChrysophyteH2.ASY1.ANO1.585.1 assembled CDS
MKIFAPLSKARMALTLLFSLCFLVLLKGSGGASWNVGEVLQAGSGSSQQAADTSLSSSASSSSSQSLRPDGVCSYWSDASEAVKHALCAVETGAWRIPPSSRAITEAPCLIDQALTRCQEGVRHVPTQKETPASEAPPEAKNKDYQRFAEKAEELVPKTWWRDGFASDQLLLSHSDKELPTKQFNERKSMNNKKLKNLVQCVTRQQFIRKAFSFSEDINTGTNPDIGPSGSKGDKCAAQQEPSVQAFFTAWTSHSNGNGLFGGVIRKHADTSMLKAGEEGMPSKGWYTNKENDDGDLYIHATEALQYYYMNTGGIWTGCFKMAQSSYCRGGLAAAALVTALHVLEDIVFYADKKGGSAKLDNNIEIGQSVVQGYMLASLGRGLLHGDTDTTGDGAVTEWKCKLADFTLLQQAFLKLYMDTFGTMYTNQLNDYLPLAFPPFSGSDSVYTKKKWNKIVKKNKHFLEPVYSNLRNWMYTEGGNLIDFGPYRPLVAIPEVNSALQNGKRILIDVGANGFFASPKYLLDSYAPYLPFTHAVMIEPEPHFSASIPEAYSKRYEISIKKIYAEVNTGTENDILKLVGTLVTPDDYVVLKFDVDPNKFAQGPTMEWGFLFDLARNPAVAELVDELYIELHFHYPALYWKHYHSNWEALDAIRYLREQGAVIHAWP